MTLLTILERLLIEPLKIVFEIVFDYANQFSGHPGMAIVFLSLAMNILVLPLYRSADALQEQARDREEALRGGVDHIKKTFSGDERMMILQAYYRQNHYSPLQTLNGSVSLLLEIPFFIAAYQFLSHLTILSGVSFGPIRDLGAPDGLLAVGGLQFNLLPILMTLINVVSSAIYLKGYPLKSKIQLYAMAAFFLVFLYSSPSCLLLYWTLNNVFSLVKNIFYKLKNPKKILCLLCAAAGAAALALAIAGFGKNDINKTIFLAGAGVLLLLPMGVFLWKQKGHGLPKLNGLEPDRRVFLLGSVFLTVLMGLLIPSVYIADSPQEYVDINYFSNPLWYIVSAGCISAGTFLVWLRVFYWLATPGWKVVFDRGVWVLCGIALVDYMFFGTDLGVISSELQYENGMYFTLLEKGVNLLVLIGVAAVMLLVIYKWRRVAVPVLLVAVIAMGGMTALNVVTIKRSLDNVTFQEEAEEADELNFQISTTGKNVVVIMLDRAMGEYVPYIFNEKPELKEQFSGFTYYANTISFGGRTNFGSPALMGGYEYTPVEMNKRNTEPLVVKQNEALKVMPTLFSENGYDVTVCDPTLANYQWIPDISIYDDCPGVKAYITNGRFVSEEDKQLQVEKNFRNFFCFSATKCMPLFLQPVAYNLGRYHNLSDLGQVVWNMSEANGVKNTFLAAYNFLENLPVMTNVTEEDKNSFLLITNDTTHEVTLLQEPDYMPSMEVDNTEYDAEHMDRFTVDGVELKMSNSWQVTHYHANMAAMIQLGKWFDSLKAAGAYDNTRIILVADHGRDTLQLESLVAEGGEEDSLLDLEQYFPLLMVKDFDAEGFVTSEEFMTNADVPTLAMERLIQDPMNPYTGKAINSDEKTAHEQYVIMSNIFSINENNGNTFLPARWASVKDDMRDVDNWTFYEGETVLDEYAAP